MCTFLLQNGKLWDIWLVHCGIYATGLMVLNLDKMKQIINHVHNSWQCSVGLIQYTLIDDKFGAPAGMDTSSHCSCHYNDVIMGAMASHMTSLAVVYSTVYSGADQRKHQSSASLAFVRGIHRWLVNSPHKGPVMRKMFLFVWRHHDEN